MLKLYNTRTKRKEDFVPLDPNNVRMYVCGPTVYDYAHIGNARPIIVFDVLFRLLRHLAAKGEWDGGKGQTQVTYVRNITDVDDKINARAAEEGISIRELTERTTKQFHEDIRALGVLMPEDVNEPGKPPRFIEPRATEHIPDMIALIERLIERGHAYPADGHVLFHVPSDPDYGKLARRSLDEMRAGARVEVAPYKRDPMDFVLWKPSTGSEPGWDSPWGFGRPGWHIECSAMSAALLGETFDIHGGGIDLVFPHHENEVAQSTCAHGTDIMANIWMHNGFLQVEGEKMSKSLGNFITIREVLEGWRDFCWRGEDIRLAMLSTHYRQPIDWTVDKLEQASNLIDEVKTFGYEDPQVGPTDVFINALMDDLNTPLAISILHGQLKEARYAGLAQVLKPGMPTPRISNDTHLPRAQLWANLKFLGIDAGQYERPKYARAVGIDTGVVRNQITARNEARRAKNWAEADRIRDELAAMGITLKDKKNPETGEIETEWEITR